MAVPGRRRRPVEPQGPPPGEEFARSARKRGFLRAAASLLRATFQAWVGDKAPKLAAALAYYTAFSVAPLILIAISVAGLFFGRQAARGEIVRQISGLVGREGGLAIQSIIEKAWRPGTGVLATVLGVAALLLGASGVFGELQDSLNIVWRVARRPDGGILRTLRARFLSFTMVLGIGFLLLVSLVLSAALQALDAVLRGWGGDPALLKVLSLAFSFGVTATLFALMYRVLPDARTRWRDIWFGGVVTALLFTAGKFLIGLYLGRSTIGSAYGAAGSFVVFLLWIYYSSQIFFFGAEFTRVFAERYGAGVVPSPAAEPLYAERCRRTGLEPQGPRGAKGGGKGRR